MARQTISQRRGLGDLRSINRANAGVRGQIIVHGIEDMAREFKALPYIIVDKMLKRAVYEGAQMYTRKAKENVPFDKGKLEASLSTRRKTLPTLRLAVQSDTYARKGRNFRGGYYAHLVEHGHDLFRTTRSGKYFIKHVPATNFLRKTAVQNKEEAVTIVKKRVGTGLLLYYSGRKRF